MTYEPILLDDFIASLPPEEQARIQVRSAELIEEELTLRDMRQAQKFTQERLAEILGIEQESVSRLERRADLLLSTLQSYVTAMGGKLRLMAEFPGRQPVAIALGDIGGDTPAPKRKRLRKT
jgi:DNA-binding XRE family transcriptional regulator